MRKSESVVSVVVVNIKLRVLLFIEFLIDQPQYDRISLALDTRVVHHLYNEPLMRWNLH